MPRSSKRGARPAAPATSRPADATYPAYGYMNREWMFDVETRRVPSTFMVGDRPGTAPEWKAFLDVETIELARMLWPRFDGASSTWQGASVAWMDALTRADLRLMDTLADELPRAPSVGDTAVKATHQALFEVDDVSPPGALYPSLDVYLPDLPADLLLTLKAAIKKMSVEFGPAPLRYKEYMQRPRPYQVAHALGTPFRYEFARSAVSPALPSGHCLQGLVRHAAAFVANPYLIVRHPGAMDALAQHAVDYGDRRVYAGVHYPSDNIASWFLALRLCGVLYGYLGQAAKTFMWKAIQQSKVFTALTAQVARDGKSVYAGPLAELAAEAARPAPRPPG